MASSVKGYYFLFLLLTSVLFAEASAELSPIFYLLSCPSALSIIREKVLSAIEKEPRMAASLLRLHFHDCFVNGCDGSVLLDDTATFRGEKTAFPNMNSLRGFEVVDSIKSVLEKVCPETVSCADILAVAARDSVRAMNGPFWKVLLGRRDSTTASFNDANKHLPPPFFSLEQLTSSFANKGLSIKEMVALSGSHTIGMARCVLFRDHIYKDPDVNIFFSSLRKWTCPSTAGNGDDNLAPLDMASSNDFDNSYFKNLVKQQGLLHSDQELYNKASTDSIVLTYSNNQTAFFVDFQEAMIKMGNIDLLTGTNGEIRKNCRLVNS